MLCLDFTDLRVVLFTSFANKSLKNELELFLVDRILVFSNEGICLGLELLLLLVLELDLNLGLRNYETLVVKPDEECKIYKSERI